MKAVIILTTVILHNQLATSQILRPQFTRPIAEQIIENGKFINLPPSVITEPASTNIIPIPNIIPSPRTTLITDCSPSICENLANTIQLMIVCNLLQNRYSSDFANKLTMPVLNDVLTSPAPNNVIMSNVIMPKIVNPSPPSNIVSNYIPPSFYPNVIPPMPSMNPHNIVLPSVNPQNMILPSVIPPNVITPSMITPSVIPPGVIPTAVAPSCPNAPQVSPANVNALLNSLMSMLGNIRG
ncbi:36.4 kDa proline-rich protein-like [Spodoptera litura]|uniref:36.4 kDa proline-rich protein-like n=1 Tax=Spodoptera litura TaxID=69820 RepID=A0A9J7IJT5_SPOLT|nr:36.4 kDa proline-rich protein-like [Spodoptera litura]